MVDADDLAEGPLTPVESQRRHRRLRHVGTRVGVHGEAVMDVVDASAEPVPRVDSTVARIDLRRPVLLSSLDERCQILDRRARADVCTVAQDEAAKGS